MSSNCHAEGRGFESHQPLEKAPLVCGAFRVPGPRSRAVPSGISCASCPFIVLGRSSALGCGPRLGAARVRGSRLDSSQKASSTVQPRTCSSCSGPFPRGRAPAGIAILREPSPSSLEGSHRSQALSATVKSGRRASGQLACQDVDLLDRGLLCQQPGCAVHQLRRPAADVARVGGGGRIAAGAAASPTP